MAGTETKEGTYQHCKDKLLVFLLEEDKDI